MSLDVYLTLASAESSHSNSGIFIRENGQTIEITRAEWDERFPGREPVIAISQDEESNQVYSANITHNLGKMAKEAGVYQYLWYPDELNIKKATDLIIPLSAGLELLESDPEHFKGFNPSNGWGDYEGLVEFICDYLDACKKYPEADISVSR